MENGIDLSFQQVVVNQAVSSGIEITKTQKKEADKFVKNQGALSIGLEHQEDYFLK